MVTPPIEIRPEFLRLISEIDEFKGRWQAMRAIAPDQLANLKKVATIESVGSSTRIEGARLSDKEVEKLLSGLDLRHFKSRDEEEVAGYAAVMEMVFESYGEIQTSENHIKQLHQVLLKFSEKDARHRGEYKKFPNHVEAFDTNGKSLGIVFETASPFDTPSRMSDLVSWLNEQWELRRLHPILITAVFIVYFLAIHPFQDGNGRLSRILTTLLLLKAGYSFVPFASLERVVEENKEHYYLALRRTQSTLYTGKENLHDWILFFLKALRKHLSVLTSKIETAEAITKLPPLSLEIVRIARQQGKITVRDVVNATGANRNTIKAHMKKMVNIGKLEQRGVGKGTWYTPC